MVQQLSRLATLAAILAVGIGCGKGEADVATSSPAPAPKAADAEAPATTNWTPQQQEAFRSALKRARSGEEGGGVPGSAPSYSGSPVTNAPAQASESPANNTYAGGSTSSSPTPHATPASPGGRPNEVGSTGSDPMVGK